jgi:hypothetical protein
MHIHRTTYCTFGPLMLDMPEAIVIIKYVMKDHQLEASFSLLRLR